MLNRVVLRALLELPLEWALPIREGQRNARMMWLQPVGWVEQRRPRSVRATIRVGRRAA
jgi:hypothetical protein